MDIKQKMLITKAIQVAQELENRLNGLGLYLAGTPATIRADLEKMLKGEIHGNQD